MEVLIASIIASFAIAAAMQLMIDQNRHHLIQEGVTGLQQNSRAAVDELVGKIRQAGYRLEPGINCLYSWNSNPDTIAVVFMAEPLCTASLSEGMSLPSSPVTCEDSDMGGFASNTWLYIYDAVKDSGEFFFATDVNEGAHEVQHNLGSLSKSYSQGANLFKLDYYKYYVDRSDSLHPVLKMVKNGADPVTYADNILDLQFRYRLANGAIHDTVAVDRFVRQIEISVVSRTEKSDLFLADYRYDTLRSSAMVRNLAM